MIKKLRCFFLCVFTIGLCLSTIPYHGLDSHAIAETTSTPVLPEISPNQTANMKLAFLGVSSEYINQSSLMALLPQTVKQFADPNSMNWTLNFSLVFYPFPDNASD